MWDPLERRWVDELEAELIQRGFGLDDEDGQVTVRIGHRLSKRALLRVRRPAATAAWADR
jgi:hypothetical protein